MELRRERVVEGPCRFSERERSRLPDRNFRGPSIVRGIDAGGAFSASPEMRERPRTAQGQTAVETGSRKPAGLRGASERTRAIWTPPAHLHAGRRQPSMRRNDRPDTRKRLTRRPELDKEKSRVAGASTHEGTAQTRNYFHSGEGNDIINRQISTACHHDNMTENPTPPLHLDSLSIQGFRGIQKLEIPKLGRVTLITGKNDVGKTTVLEAAQLYGSRGNEEVLYSLLDKHEETSVFSEDDGPVSDFYDFTSLFFGRDISENSSIRIGPRDLSNNDQLEISTKDINDIDDQILEELERAYNTFPHELEPAILEVSFSESVYRIPFDRILGTSLPRARNLPRYRRIVDHPDKFDFRILGPSPIDNNLLSIFWDKVETIGIEAEKRAIYGLNLALADKVDRVTMIGDWRRPRGRRAAAKYSDGRKSASLRSFGDGAVRLYGYSLALACRQNGFLLIDEVENGIHHSIFENFWRIVLQMADENNVQVIATTHNFDCVKGFARAVVDFSEIEGALVRMESFERKNYVISYSESELEAVSNQGIEVR